MLVWTAAAAPQNQKEQKIDWYKIKKVLSFPWDLLSFFVSWWEREDEIMKLRYSGFYAPP